MKSFTVDSRLRLIVPALTAALGLFAGAPLLQAQTWDAGGAATNLNWSTVANWNPDGVPATTANVIFTGGTSSATSAATVTSIVEASRTVAGLTFNHILASEFHHVQIATGATLTVNGTTSLDMGIAGTGPMTTNVTFSGPGAMNISNVDGSMDLGTVSSDAGSNHTSILNVSGLGSFSTNVNELNVGFRTRSSATLSLSNTTNSVTANIIRVGNSNGGNAGDPSFLNLGTGVNNITTNTLEIGISKATGSVVAPVGGGTLTLTGKSGAATNISIGVNATASTTATAVGTLDLRGVTANVNAGNVIIGHRTNTGNGGATGTLYFSAGTFTANSIVLGLKTSSSTNLASGELNISGGTFTVNAGGTFSLGSQATAGTSRGTLNLSGGTLVSNTNITDEGGATTSIINLIGGTLDMKGFAIGNATTKIDTLNFATGTLANIGQINGGDALIKSTAGVLTLEGTNSFTGGINVSVGTLTIGSGSITGDMSSGGVTVQASGTLAFNRRDVYDVTNIITSAGGTIQQIGVGNTRLLSANAASGVTFAANQGILTAVNTAALGTTATVSVASAGKFYFLTGGPGNASLTGVSTINVANGGTLGVGFGDTMVTGSLVAAGTVYVDVHSRANLAPDGTYTILTSGAGLPAGVTAGNVRFYGLTNSVVVGGPTVGANSVTVTMAALPQEILDILPTVLYWKGGYAGATGVWGASNGILNTEDDYTLSKSNWSTVRNGDVLYALSPNGNTDVIFAADSADPTYMTNTSLGVDLSVRSVSVDGQASGPASTAAVTVNDAVYKLTITGGDSTSTVRLPSIYVAPTTGGLTLNVDVNLTAALPLLTVGMTDGSQLGVGSLAMSGVISGNGFTKRGAGSLAITGLEANTFTGVTRIEQGAVTLGKTAGLNAISGSELYIGEATLSAAGLFASVTLNAANQISDAIDVTIYTGSSLNLNGNAETIGALSGTGTVTSATTGILTVGTGDKSSTFSGVISGAAGLTKVGTGTLTLGGATASTNTGATSIQGGTLLYSAANALGSGGLTVNGATTVMDMNGFSDSVGGVTLTGGAQIIGAGSTLTTTGTSTLQNGVISVNIAGTQGFNKSGDGLVILSGNNTFAGNVTLGGGAASILRITSSTALGTTTGNITINGDATNLATLELVGDIVVNENMVLGARQAASANAAALRNQSGNNVWAGTITFTTGGSNYNIESAAGTLTITGQISGGATTGSTRTLQLYGASDGIVTGSIVNGTGTPTPASVNVVKFGTGTWTLAGVNSYTGTTTVSGGTLRVTNSSGLGGTSSLTVATGASFFYNSGSVNNNITVGSLSLADGSTVGVDLGSAIVSTGAATTAGTITFDVIGITGANYLSQQYNVLTAASGLDVASYTIGKMYNVSNFTVNSIGKTATSVYLDVTAVADEANLWWKGGFSASEGNVWAVSNGTTRSNWARDVNGTDSVLTPGATTNVIFSANGATNQADPMQLGVSMSIGSVTVNSTNPVFLSDVTNTLTLNNTNAITVNAGAGLVTLDTNLVFSNAASLVNVAGSSQLLLTRVRGNAFTKTGTGTLTLDGSVANDYTGTLRAHGGLTLLNKPGSVAAVSGNLEVGDTGGSTATVRLGAAEQIVNTSDVTVNSGGTLDLNGFNETIDGLSGSGIVLTSAANATLTLGAGNEASSVFSGSLRNGVGGVLSIVKNGTGALTLSGTNTYSGTMAINQGTVIVGTTNALSTTGAVTMGTAANVARLEINAASQTLASLVFTSNTATANEVVIGANRKLTITGATGLDLGTGASNAAMTTNANFTGGGALVVNNTSANMELGIAFATINSGSNHTAALNLSGLSSFVANVNEVRLGYGSLTTGTLTLTNTYNSITATTTHVGSSTGSNAGTVSTLLLGTGTNILRTDTLNIGVSKALGNVVASAPGGLVTIAGKTGAATNIIVGSTAGTGTAATPAGTLDLRGMTATVTAGTLTLGRRDGGDNGGATGTVYFDGGTFTANTVAMAAKTGTGTGAATATLNISNGVFTVNSGGSFTLASQAGSGSASGTVNLSGGTLVSNVDIRDGAGNATSTINLIGGTLDMTGHNLGDATNIIDVINLSSGTLKNVLQINGGTTAFTKVSAGTLYLAGTNGYTGATVVSGGTLWARSSTALQGTASLTVNTGAAFRYTAGALGNNLTLKSGAGFTLQNGSTLGVELGNQIIVQGAATTAGAAVTVDVFGIAGATYTAGPYTVVTATSGLDGGTYSLGNFYNLSGYTVSSVNATSTSLILNVATATALTDAYWKGGYANGANVWAISNGSTASNWTTDAAGNVATGQVAGANTNVIFSAAGATNETDMRLGADMAVGSLRFENTSAVALNDLDNKLKVNNANAITVTSTGPVTLKTQLTLDNAVATVNVADAAGVLNLEGSVSGKGLTKTGAGRLSMTGVNAFTGAVALNAGSTFMGGTTSLNSLNVASGARLEAMGTLNSTNTMTIAGTLAVGNESLAAPVISTLTIGAAAGEVNFQSGSVLTFDLFNGAGAGGGQSDIIAINGNLVISSNVSLQVDTNGMTGWAAGDSWKLFDWSGIASVSGAFSTTNLDAVLSGTGLNWDYSALYSSGIITVAVPEPSRALLLLISFVALCQRRRRAR